MSRNSLGCSCTLVDSHCASVTFLFVVVDVVVGCVGGGISVVVVVARRTLPGLRTMSSLLRWNNNWCGDEKNNDDGCDDHDSTDRISIDCSSNSISYCRVFESTQRSYVASRSNICRDVFNVSCTSLCLVNLSLNKTSCSSVASSSSPPSCSMPRLLPSMHSLHRRRFVHRWCCLHHRW